MDLSKYINLPCIGGDYRCFWDNSFICNLKDCRYFNYGGNK